MNDPDVAGTLRSARMIWAALLSGPMLFFLVIMGMWAMGNRMEDDAEMHLLMFYMACAMLAIVTPLGYFTRRQIYRSGRQGNTVAPRAYLSGNLVFWSMLEGVSLFSLVISFVTGTLWPAIVLVVIATAIQFLNYPDGAEMRDRAS